MSTVADRTLSEWIPAPSAMVRAFYVDLDNIRLVHPLVVSVRRTRRRGVPDGYLQVYRVRDRIPFGPLSLRVGYTATVRVPAVGDIRTEARQFPAVRIDGTVSFEAEGGGTRLTEQLRISAPAPLAAFTVRQAAAAHIVMLAGIRRYFEDRA